MSLWPMQSFRRLDVWRKAHALALNVRRVTRGFSRGKFASLRSQIRSAESVPFNIVEGCDANSRKEFARYREISIKSKLRARVPTPTRVRSLRTRRSELARADGADGGGTSNDLRPASEREGCRGGSRKLSGSSVTKTPSNCAPHTPDVAARRRERGLASRLQPDPDSERRELIAPFLAIHEREGESLDVVRHAGADESGLHLQPGLAREARVVRSHAIARRVQVAAVIAP